MNIEDKLYWYDESTGDLYAKQDGATQPPNTIEVDYARGQELLAILLERLDQESSARGTITDRAKAAVRRTLSSTIVVNGIEYTVQNELIHYLVNFVNLRVSIDGSTQFNWYNKDYERVTVTLQDLRTLLRLYQDRVVAVLEQYNNWLATDRTEEFEYVEA